MIENPFADLCKNQLKHPELNRPDWVNGIYRNPNYLWLDKNENVDPKFHKIVQDLLKNSDVEWLLTYPESSSLYRKISTMDGVSPRQCLLTAGSDGAIRQIFEGFIGPGDRVCHTNPTFAMYDVYCKIYGANKHAIEYHPSDNGPILSLGKLLESIRKVQPKLLCLPNPDSPTGTVFDPLEIEKIVATCSKNNCLVLIDEAYYFFYNETAVRYIEKFKNLFVARTFSKAWGVSGLRVGYLVAQESLISILHKIRPMYEVNTFAVNFISKLIDLKDELNKSVARLNAGKEFFSKEMNDLGFETPETYGNFLHVCFGNHAPIIHSILENKLHYRKSFSHPSLAKYSRITSTTTDNFKPIVKSIRDAVKSLEV